MVGRKNPVSCDRTPTLPYLAWFDECARRYKRGERQYRCSKCQGYYWPRWIEDAAKHGITVDPATARPMEAYRGCLVVQFGRRGKS